MSLYSSWDSSLSELDTRPHYYTTSLNIHRKKKKKKERLNMNHRQLANSRLRVKPSAHYLQKRRPIQQFSSR